MASTGNVGHFESVRENRVGGRIRNFRVGVIAVGGEGAAPDVDAGGKIRRAGEIDWTVEPGYLRSPNHWGLGSMAHQR